MKKFTSILLGVSLLMGTLYASSTTVQNITPIQQEHIKLLTQDIDYGG